MPPLPGPARAVAVPALARSGTTGTKVMNFVILAVIAAVISVSSFLAGDKWRSGIVAARDLKATQDNARVQILRADRADQAAERHEKGKAAIEVRYETITKEVQHVVEKPVYRNVCLDDDGLRVIGDALAAASAGAASQPARSVSAPGGT